MVPISVPHNILEPNWNRFFSQVTTRNWTGTTVPVPVPGNFGNGSTLERGVYMRVRGIHGRGVHVGVCG
jgi:hypothetical protein